MQENGHQFIHFTATVTVFGPGRLAFHSGSRSTNYQLEIGRQQGDPRP